MPFRNCDRCGKEYKYKKCKEGKTKWCSRTCTDNRERPKLTCVVCKTVFTYSGPKSNYKAKTCGKECYDVLRSSTLAQRNRDNRIHDLLGHECLICGEKYSNTREDSKTCSKECHAEHLSSIYKGRKLTKSWIENQNKSKTRDKIVKYGDFSCPSCGKGFETNTSLRAHKAACGKGIKSTCDICGKVFSTQRGMKIHRNHHNADFNERISNAIRKSIKDRPPMRSTSKAEIHFYEELQNALGLDVVHKFRFDGCAHEFDFFIPTLNLIIEFDGDYWHGNRKTQKSLSPRMKQQRRIDETYSEKARSSGYNIIRVWDSESQDFIRNIECSSSKSSLLLEISRNQSMTSK